MSSSHQSRVYYPSPRDILYVSALLASTPLPAELIDTILDQAEYWASITARLGPEADIKAIGRQREHVLLLRCKPLCSGAADEGRFTEVNVEQKVGVGSDERAETSGIEADYEGAARVAVADEAEETEQGPWARYYANLPADQVPEPRNKFPARRITWRIRSHDQGWGGEGGDVYEKSWTGFWGNVLRLESVGGMTDRNKGEKFELPGSKEYLETWESLDKKDLEKVQNDESKKSCTEKDIDKERVWPRGTWCFGPTKIQANARADREFREHNVVWDFRDDIDAFDLKAIERLVKAGRGPFTGAGIQVRALQRGDMVELYSYAFFPGWTNTVEEAEVRIEFAL